MPLCDLSVTAFVSNQGNKSDSSVMQLTEPVIIQEATNYVARFYNNNTGW